jgi:hypothetical protein
MTEGVLHIRGARVVLAEYDVIQHDFPELRDETLSSTHPELLVLCNLERQALVHALIDEWLLSHSAFISIAQAAHTKVNSLISTDGNRTTAYRPPFYGRAAVVPIGNSRSMRAGGSFSSGGLLDLKGVGVSPERIPSHGYRSSGLEYLGIALSDFLLKKVIDEIFARDLPTMWTVPVYAVLDLGFDIIQGIHGTGPAGMHVRRAHRRVLPGADRAIEHEASFEIECTLRRYGITAATKGMQLHITRHDNRVVWQSGGDPPFCPKTVDRVAFSLALLDRANPITLDQRDVQLAREVDWPPARGQMVDFGHLRVEPRFDFPLVRNPQHMGLDNLVWPDSSVFIQPDPLLCLPHATWRRRTLVDLCFDLATQFRSGNISKTALRERIDHILRTLLDRW